MAGGATVMNGIIQRIDRDAGSGASGAGMAGRANSRHGHCQAVIDPVGGGMNGQPIAAMASITVSGTVDGEADQHPPTSLVVTETAVIMMDNGEGIPRIVATLASVIGCGADRTAMVDIGMARKIVGAVTGIAIIKSERIVIRHGLANGAADQGDGGCSRGVAGSASIMTLGIGGAGAKYRRMAVNGTGGQDNRRRLAAIFIGADITGLVVIGMTQMTIKTGNNRMLGIVTDDIGN